MGNLALHCAEEPDNLRATTGTVEVPTERDNDAALALGARPIRQHEPAARHRSRTPPPIAARVSGGPLKLPSGSGLSPAAKRIWALENAFSDIFGCFM